MAVQYGDPARYSMMQQQRQDEQFRNLLNMMMGGKQIQARQQQFQQEQSRLKAKETFSQEMRQKEFASEDRARKVNEKIAFMKMLQQPDLHSWQELDVYAKNVLDKSDYGKFRKQTLFKLKPVEEEKPMVFPKTLSEETKAAFKMSPENWDKFTNEQKEDYIAEYLRRTRPTGEVTGTSKLTTRRITSNQVEKYFVDIKNRFPEHFGDPKEMDTYRQIMNIHLDLPLQYNKFIRYKEMGISTPKEQQYIEKADQTREFFLAMVNAKGVDFKDAKAFKWIHPDDKAQLDMNVLKHLMMVYKPGKKFLFFKK